MEEVAADAEAALSAGNVNLAQQLVNVIVEFSPNLPVVGRVQAEASRRATLATAMANADAALAGGNLVTPEGESANDLYRRVLELDAGNQQAEAGLDATFDALLARALEQAQDLDFEAAEASLAAAGTVRENPDAVAETRTSIADFRERHLEELDQSVTAAIDSGDFDQAEAGITRLVALDYPRSRIDALQVSLSDARLYGSLEPGQVFFPTRLRHWTVRGLILLSFRQAAS